MPQKYSIILQKYSLILAICCISALAHGQVADSLRTVERQWLFGVGASNILDTYLSPLEYTGLGLSLIHCTERQARFCKPHVSVVAQYSAFVSRTTSPTRDAHYWDGSVRAVGGLLRQWHPSARWRLALGGMADAAAGTTYNTRNGNNPAQARFEASLDAHALAEYAFPLWKRTARLRLEATAPLIGVAFSPRFGQSYYEIVSLQQHDRNALFTHFVNAPSARLGATIELPLLGARLTLGYMADIRQSRFHHIKHHAWQNHFVVGYTRNLHICR